jgi:hypothetical protein
MEQRLDFAFQALDEALKRAETAELHDRFGPLAESLLWVVLLNDTFWEDNERAYRRARFTDPDGRTIEGLRYARHRLVHDIRVYGLHGVIYFGGDFNADDFCHDDFDVGMPQWTWRDINKLAKATRRRGEDIYMKCLEGKDVTGTLNAAADFLRRYRTAWTPAVEEG